MLIYAKKHLLKLVFLTLFLTLSWSKSFAQTTYTLNGYVKEVASGEALIGALVRIPRLNIGTVTNDYGFYSISISEDIEEVEVSYMGYHTEVVNIAPGNTYALDVYLKESTSELEEVVITGNSSENINTRSISVEELSIAKIKEMPTLLGEVDVIRSIQSLPGVTTVGEGATGFNVRGGSIDQNLVLLDEAPIYNASHAFGFFSAFNPDIVSDVKLYKGGIPAKYGGRISSVLDVKMKEGNNQGLAVSGGMGLVFSRIAIEAPIVSGKSSFIIAGRRSYADLVAGTFFKGDLENTDLNFYDLALKANYHLNKKDHLYISGYFGRDNFKLQNEAGFNWGNELISARWNHLFSDRLFSNLTVFRSYYDYHLKYGGDVENTFDWDANITNYAIKPKLSYYVNPNNLVSFGGELMYSVFAPGNAVGVSEGEAQDISLEKKYGMEGAIYLENKQNLSQKITLHYGLRLSVFSYLGGTKYYYEDNDAPGQRKVFVSYQKNDRLRFVQSYFNLEPRFSFSYAVTPSSTLKLGYNRTTQYVHLISNSVASTPLDVWSPSTNNIKPQLSDQLAIGYSHILGNANKEIELSAEIYYKKIHQLTEYVEGANLFLNKYLEGELIDGKGRAYGLELHAEKKQGRFTSSIAYTYSHTARFVEGINNSEWFPSRFDQPHSLTISGSYLFGKRLLFAANFQWNTGTPTTLPTSRVEQQGYILPYNSNEARNNVRLPDYHRLDLSLTLKSKAKKRLKNEFTLGVYNAYSRRNPFTIYFRPEVLGDNETSVTSTELVRLSILGSVIPSLSWNFKF